MSTIWSINFQVDCSAAKPNLIQSKSWKGYVILQIMDEKIPRTSKEKAFLYCFLNWLVPGLGYILCKDYPRGLTLLVLINACFVIGVFLGGYILPPLSWVPRNPEFNLVSILTYLSQAFHGSGWLGLQYLHEASSSDPEAYFSLTNLAGKSSYSDLGVFHLVVAGGLNYFATVRLYDLMAGTPELSESEAAEYEKSKVKQEDVNG